MSLLLKRKKDAPLIQNMTPYTSEIDSDNPYYGMDEGVLIYQNKQGKWLDKDQQPRPGKPRKYNPHQSTRYKNVVIGENGNAKCYDVKSGLLKESDKVLPELYKRREECCGCSACYAVCPTRKFLLNESRNSTGKQGEHYLLPHGAIYMEEDEEGFLYPVVDASLCIRCNKCIQVCPIKLKNNNVKEND